MGRKAIELGPTARTVATNVRRFRTELRGWTMAELAERMATTARPMTGNQLSAIETLIRRIDVDDLIALAAGLGVSPSALLMPHVTSEDVHDPDDPSLLPEVPLVTSAEPLREGEATHVDAGRYWQWLIADSPLDATYYMTDERDEFAIEAWRRDQVPPWAYRSRPGASRG